MDANSTLLNRIYEPEAARALVELKCDPDVQARVDELAEKCNDGLLTKPEREEYDAYVDANTFISILKAKARTIIREANDIR